MTSVRGKHGHLTFCKETAHSLNILDVPFGQRLLWRDTIMLTECASVLAENLQPERHWIATGEDGNYQSNEAADKREIT